MPEPCIVIANLGTPAAPTEAAVRRFLAEFLADPEVIDLPRWLWLPVLHGIVLRRRPARVARQYREIWGEEGSPLDVGTRRIATALARALGGRADVEVAYRYGEPRVDRVVERALREGRTVLLADLFPQPAGATSGTIEALARVAAERAGAEARLRFHRIAPDAPGYVAAQAERCREAFGAADDGPPEHLVVSFHGLPARYDRREGGGYSRACERTFDALLAALDWPRERATLAYQSRFGPERWLAPATSDVIEKLARGGAQTVAVTCPGFLTEGLETLEEIGLRGAADFERAGGKRLLLAGAVVDHPRFVGELAEGIGRLIG